MVPVDWLKVALRHDHSQLNLELDVCGGYLQNTSAHYFRVLSKARSHSFASPCFRPRSSLENRPPRAWDSRGLEKRHTYKSVAFSSADCSQAIVYLFFKQSILNCIFILFRRLATLFLKLV